VVAVVASVLGASHTPHKILQSAAKSSDEQSAAKSALQVEGSAVTPAHGSTVVVVAVVVVAVVATVVLAHVPHPAGQSSATVCSLQFSGAERSKLQAGGSITVLQKVLHSSKAPVFAIPRVHSAWQRDSNGSADSSRMVLPSSRSKVLQ
jgi:hypothetical protein